MSIINLLFSALLTGFGAVGLVRQLRELARAWSSRRWSIGEAVVVRAAVHERRGSRGRTVFEPDIEYQYAFRDREFTGHRLAFGDISSGDRSEAEKDRSEVSAGHGVGGQHLR